MPENNDELEMLKALEADVASRTGQTTVPAFDVNKAFEALEEDEKDVLKELSAERKAGEAPAKTVYKATLPDGTEVESEDPNEVIKQLSESAAKPAEDVKPGLKTGASTGLTGPTPPAQPAAAPPEDAPEWSDDKFVDTFFKTPADAIAAAVDVKFGKKDALKRMAEATSRVEKLQKQLELREAQAFLTETQDYPQGDVQLDNFIGGLVRQAGADFTRENLKAAWEHAKTQGWVNPAPVKAGKTENAEPKPETKATAVTPSPAAPPPVPPGTSKSSAAGRTGPIGGPDGNPALATLHKLLDSDKSMDEIEAVMAKAGLDMPGSLAAFETAESRA